jgi:GWxTD domain-containing protein
MRRCPRDGEIIMNAAMVLRSLGIVIVITAASRMATAQPLPGAPALTWRASSDPVVAKADSLVTATDTVRAIDVLETALRPRSTNAAVWHRYGILRWQRVARVRNGGYVNDAYSIASLRMADSALRLATQFAPDSAEYWMTLAQFNLQSGIGSMRFAAEGQMARAREAADRTQDSLLMAATSDALGMATWRRFESTRNRALVGAGQRVQFQTDGRWQRAHAKDYLDTFSKKIQPPTGTVDYLAASAHFLDALRAAPNTLAYARHVYMANAVGGQWEALLALATRRATASAFDADARLARGLALQRLRRTREARLAFDSAVAMMDERESAMLFRTDRILPTGPNVLTGQRGMDQRTFAALPAGQRATMSAIFWALNDPVMTTPENEAQLEFMARVVQADWQWSDALQGVCGADTDRGDIFVRYGPPDEEMTLPGSASVQQDASKSGELPEDYWAGGAPGSPSGGGPTGGMTSTSQEVGSTLAWVYRSGEVFFFEIAPGFGRARTPLTDQKYVSEIGSVKPAAWANLQVPTRADTLALRTTRFRASGDSTDVVVVTRLPLRSLVADTSEAVDSATINGALRVDLAVIDGAARAVARDSVRTTLSKATLGEGGVRTWTTRVAKGAVFIRIDALGTDAHSDARRAASATTGIDATPANGFALSDLLLVVANSATPPATAQRWRDLALTPSTGDYRAGETIGVVWETYDLGADAEGNRYRVDVTVERLKRSGAAGLALRVLDGLGTLIKQERASGDRLAIAFDRRVAAKAIQAEYFALQWLGDARGEFQLRLAVTDLLTNRVSARDTRFRIR